METFGKSRFPEKSQLGKIAVYKLPRLVLLVVRSAVYKLPRLVLQNCCALEDSRDTFRYNAKACAKHTFCLHVPLLVQVGDSGGF